jgi:hypothetical protein
VTGYVHIVIMYILRCAHITIYYVHIVIGYVHIVIMYILQCAHITIYYVHIVTDYVYIMVDYVHIVISGFTLENVQPKNVQQIKNSVPVIFFLDGDPMRLAFLSANVYLFVTFYVSAYLFVCVYIFPSVCLPIECNTALSAHQNITHRYIFSVH